jgi:vacuolar-type H+-ATPase subunit I/STV1
MVTVDDNLEIQGEVSLDLKTYEQIKGRLSILNKQNAKMEKRVAEIRKASKELATFLNHLARAVNNFDDYLGAFNESAKECEILKTEDNKYIINLNIDR